MTKIYWRAYTREVETMPWAADLEKFAVWHTLACLLARAVGRSKLEYLSEPERSRQRKAACGLLGKRPLTISDTVEEFIKRV